MIGVFTKFSAFRNKGRRYLRGARCTECRSVNDDVHKIVDRQLKVQTLAKTHAIAKIQNKGIYYLFPKTICASRSVLLSS